MRRIILPGPEVWDIGAQIDPLDGTGLSSADFVRRTIHSVIRKVKVGSETRFLIHLD